MYDPIWQTKDGRRIKVGQMSDQHLRNAIALVERSNDWRRVWLPRLYLERDIRRMGLR